MESWSSSAHGELRRRKVTHVAVVYVIVGIAVIEVANLILEPLELGWLYPAVVVLTIWFALTDRARPSAAAARRPC